MKLVYTLTVAAAVPMAPAARSPRASVVFLVEPLLVKVPEPATLPSVVLALRTVKVPVVAPTEIEVPACSIVTVAAFVLNRPRVAALVAIVAAFKLILPLPAVIVVVLVVFEEPILTVCAAPVLVPILTVELNAAAPTVPIFTVFAAV